MVEQFEEWQLDEALSILALEEGTTIKNKNCLIKKQTFNVYLLQIGIA